MQTYDRFIFESYDLDGNSLKLRYSLDDKVHFTEILKLPEPILFSGPHPGLEEALFALHLAGGASYYKTYCPKQIEIRSGTLNRRQADFWNKLYTHGLGEFFYRNQLDFHGLINFPATDVTIKSSPHTRPELPKRPLVLIGGGKDSMVSIELLRAVHTDQTLMRVRSHRIVTALAHAANLPLTQVERTIDPNLFELNTAGAYNGHVPITAYIIFLGFVMSLLTGHDAVVVSSERSSSYGNVDYLGMTVNHQWSKSYSAEQALRTYIADYITQRVQLINPIRPLSELHIAKLFCDWPQYFPIATSCNRNWLLVNSDPHAGNWCGTCPKCAFTFATLAAWLSSEQLIQIFGHNLFDDPSLEHLYLELWGLEGFKPFECVGTPEETQASFYLAKDKPGLKDSVIMRRFNTSVLPNLDKPNDLVKSLLTPDMSLADPLTQQILSLAGVS